ncbi:hypothetical protein M436DRAFT_80696 [Aureobasidium namibiae CBS 147.97]|uniref:Uncharacterized protein n=1 Tax=Aureobasidium namibiae CBS 147.97 TaxID=1043004 RepID=A0A074WMB9_9PEZI
MFPCQPSAIGTQYHRSKSSTWTQGKMSDEYGSAVDNDTDIQKARPTRETVTIEDDAPLIQSLTTETIVIKDNTSITQQAPATTVAPIIVSTLATKEAPMLRPRRRPRVIPFTPSRVTKASLKKTAIKTVTVDKAAQLLQIMESKTPEAKIEKPGLTQEEINEDLIAMGILHAPDQDSLTHPASGRSSSNSPGVNEDGRDASGLNHHTMQSSLSKPDHEIAASATQLPTSAARDGVLHE